MWVFVEVLGIILLTILSVLVFVGLALALIEWIKEYLIELEWIHPKYDKCDDDEEDMGCYYDQ